MRLRSIAIVVLATLVTATLAGCEGGARHVSSKVFFVDGVKLTAVERSVDKRGGEAAVRALLHGPSAQDRKRGLLTEIPEGTALRSYKLADEGKTARIELSAQFNRKKPANPVDSVWNERGAVSQVVYTATAADKVKKVDIWVGDERVASESTKSLSTPNAGKAITGSSQGGQSKQAAAPKKVPVATVDEVQRRLVELKYLPEDGATGSYDYATEMAVMAFQGWEGIDKDGDVGPQTTKALKQASAPVPLAPVAATGKAAQIFRDKGVALLVEDGQLVRAIHTSTGRPGYDTPKGTYTVYSKEEHHWSHAYNVDLPYACFFYEGYAFHEYPDVPPYPASHGCARLPSPEAPVVYGFVELGTPVQVF